MRKVVLFMHVSLDGYVAGIDGALDWISFDGELQEKADEIVRNVGSPMYGRVTYQMMENYWPTVLKNPDSSKREVEHANWVENVQKIVFSKTLQKAEWNNTLLIKDNIPEELSKLKQQPGKDLVIFGSPSLSHYLMSLNLIDAYQLTINPVLLGKGIPLFKNIENKTPLKLAHSDKLKSGVLVNYYETRKDK
ncbi:MAG: dihydrofolate reductase family protein [Spirochaetia bacterium]|nr:dihydrofolate reductase family protein [Spirochaetia bacterium]